jgi:hypothetical protein
MIFEEHFHSSRKKTVSILRNARITPKVMFFTLGSSEFSSTTAYTIFRTELAMSFPVRPLCPSCHNAPYPLLSAEQWAVM